MSKLWMSGIDFNAITVYDLYEFIQIYIRFEKNESWKQAWHLHSFQVLRIFFHQDFNINFKALVSTFIST